MSYVNQLMLVMGLSLCGSLGCAPTVESASSDKPVSWAIENPQDTTLGIAASSIAKTHELESGFLLLDRGCDALAWRAVLADAAERTIDAQYFLWKNDEAGKIMIARLLAAADRGVRIRVLIDDSMTESDPEYLAMFGAHPNVELRLFKPFGPKHDSLVMRWIDYAADMKVLNRRMHNKLYVVDGSFAVVGGRNIGSEYFDYPVPFVFRSRDLLAVGPILGKTGKAFDLYWNSDWSVPIEEVVSPVPTLAVARRNWQQLREYAADDSNYPPGFLDDPKNLKNELTALEQNLLWGQAKLLVDAVPTAKGQPQDHAELDSTGVTLSRALDESNEEVLIESAYLILLSGGFDALQQALDRGATVKLATNSMASNNHLTAFVGYRKQRKQLLQTGAQLFEMRPDAKSERQLFSKQQLKQTKMKFGLHAKTMVFDRMHTFVGSFNLDPRSVNLNSEMGLLVDSPALAQAVADSIENDIAPGNSWQVVRQADGKITWITTENGAITTETETEPMTSKERRAEADLLMAVPDKSQL